MFLRDSEEDTQAAGSLTPIVRSRLNAATTQHTFDELVQITTLYLMEKWTINEAADQRQAKAALLVETAHLYATEEVAMAYATTAPPSSFWLSMLVPADKSRDLIANMEELYRDDWLPKHGVRGANKIWRSQCFQYIAWRWALPVTIIWGALKAIKLS